MNMPYMTSVHALAQYHIAYDNDLYTAACDSISEICPKDSPDYSRLTNLLTDTALELCGHPAYHGVGWTLAQELRAVSQSSNDPAAVDAMFAAVDTYLERFRVGAAEFRDLLENDTSARTSFLIDVAQIITEDGVRSASDVPGWHGRAAYHLLSACAGYLQTAAVMFRYHNEERTSAFSYAAEKFGRALRDTLYGLNEITSKPHMPEIFKQVRAALHRIVEED